ncbi:hypothetical protein HDU97_008962 [Phlyctochytrium planicorne]|nr:hypothetical protein HDU97_008962 [Phlyctochytrium planicorne]
MEEFTDFVDTEAKRVMMVLMAKNRFLSIKEIGRFACYCVGEGSNSLGSISTTKMLKYVDPMKYFKGVLPAYTEKPSKLPGQRRKYKIAYLLMVHGDSTVLENIKFIVDELDDGSSIILIHIDLNAEELYDAVVNYLAEREANMNAILRPNSDPQPGNVHLAEYRYHGRWGHISLVWIQLSGFWELMDLADWDHVINLSALNVPMRKGREIQRILSLPKFKDKCFISHWSQYYHMASRLTRPHLPRLDNLRLEFNVFHPEEAGLMFPPYPRWKVCKHHQWIILTRDAVEYFRTSRDAAILLAFAENSWIPDEAFFCYVLINAPKFNDRIVNDNKQYITFPQNQFHPKILDMSNSVDIGDGDDESEADDPKYLFIRKVDVRQENGKELIRWIAKQHSLRYLKKDSEYGLMGGEDYVIPANFDPEDFVLKEKAKAWLKASGVRYVKVQGFKFCETLNNATFDSFAYIPEYGMTLGEMNPAMAEFVELIDGRAKKVMMLLIAKNKFLTSRLAYLLMVHGDQSAIENVKYLVEQLDDGSAIILIHVDLRYDELYEAIKSYIAQRETYMNAIIRPNSQPVPGNVFISTSRYKGRWGHISLVWMQLNGFWELLDLADWHHVINLSALNVPMRKSREIHRILDLPENRGKNFVSYWGEYKELAQRITRPHLPRMDKQDGEFNTHHPDEAGLMYPPFPRWKVCKHHQWLILSQDFVQYLRDSEEVAMSLAFAEHTWIPDESFFCYVLLNTPQFMQKLINDNKNFITFPPNRIHPKVLGLEDTVSLGSGESETERDNPRYLFARKVDVRTDEGKMLIEWIHEHHSGKYVLADEAEYGVLGGEDFVVPLEFDPEKYLKET